MALSIYTRDLAFRSILSHMSQGTPEGEIIDRVMGKYTTIKEEDRAQMRTLLNSARKARTAAEDLEAGTRGAGDIAGIPIDWSDTGQPGRWRYRVLVTSRDTTTGEEYSSVIIVHSDRTLDHSDVIQRAQEASQVQQFISDYPTRTDYTASTSQTSYQVVAIGRKP